MYYLGIFGLFLGHYVALLFAHTCGVNSFSVIFSCFCKKKQSDICVDFLHICVDSFATFCVHMCFVSLWIN